MKRIVLSLLIISAGSAMFCVARQVTASVERDLADRQAALSAQREQFNQAETDKQELAKRSRELKFQLAGSAGETVANAHGTELAALERGALMPDGSEQLLATLGFSWNTSPNFVVVSKETLTNLSLAAIQDQKLTAAACGTLAITSEERAKMEGLIARVSAQYDSWVLTHYQRDEPASNVVAQYELPLDPEFSTGISNEFMVGTTEVLGAERARLLANYSVGWMSDVGMQPVTGRTMAAPMDVGPLVLTVKIEATNRTPSYTDYKYAYDLHQGVVVNLSRWYITPKQDLPVRFRPLFPNGWADMAKREGFELPHAFSSPSR